MNAGPSPPVGADLDVVALDSAVEQALVTGDVRSLDVVGWGEISCVVAWPTATGETVACKRLPVFPDRAAFERYRDLFSEYCAALEAHGTDVVESTLHPRERRDGSVVGYCVQPRLAPEALLTRLLADGDDAQAAWLARCLIERIAATVSGSVGLDAQVANWAMINGRLRYLDVTTPFLRDDTGGERLDTDLFLASLPWVARGVTRRFLLEGIVDTYYTRRSVMLDVLGNLHKEGLAVRVAPFLRAANPRLGLDLDAADVRRYYRRDARLWSALQRLRRLDRSWQRVARRRPYPFLLPGPIERGKVAAVRKRPTATGSPGSARVARSRSGAS